MNKTIFAILVILTTGLMGTILCGWKIRNELFLAYLIGRPSVFDCRHNHGLNGKIRKRDSLPFGIGNWMRMAVIGLAQTAGVMGCIFVGLRTITAGELSILTFMNPLLVVILGTILLKLTYTIRQWLGVLLGFMGVFITLGGHLEIKMGTMLGFMSAVSWAIGTLLIKKWGEAFDIWVLTAYQMLFGGLFLLIGSFLLEKPFFIVNHHSISILLWLAIMASIVQFAVWFYLLQNGEPGKTSAFLFLAPFFGVLSGWLILGEEIRWYVMIGGLFIFLGIFLVNWTVGTQKLKEESTLTE